MPRKGDGRADHPLYWTWVSMRQRCREHPNYAGRGIAVDPRWDNFWQFVKDMGPKPTDGQRWTLERIDNDGNYSPENCRWATYSEQNKNRRRITFDIPARCRRGHVYVPWTDGRGATNCRTCVTEHNRERSLADAEKRKRERELRSRG